MQGFGGEALRERDLVEDSGVCGIIVLKWNFRKWGGGA